MESKRPSNSLPSLINWDLAASTAARLAPAGPAMTAAQIDAAVADLRAKADASVDHVHRITGLEAARDLRDSEVLIVDRATWAKANTQSFRALLQPALTALAEQRGDQFKAATAALGGTVTGGQLGTILAFLSSKVLGQFDPFAAMTDPAMTDPATTGSAYPGGRLLLVAPNVIAVEREINVDPADFRLWVCLHEQTHRVQFAAAPWLREHMMEQISRLTGSLMDHADTWAERLATGARQAIARRHDDGRSDGGHDNERSDDGRDGGHDDERSDDGRDGGHDDGRKGAGVLSLLQDSDEGEIFSHLTAVMSLLEGHANVVMDEVDASIVPSVKTIRRRFNDRGKSRGAIEKLIRQLLGLDAKMRQYSDGARFVRAVVSEAGMDGFNHVWARVENLPTEDEIHEPGAWIRRMGL